jgi:ketosteroid isomerase-like protein
MNEKANDLTEQVALLLRKVDELESRAAIRDLVTDYCIGFDKHDWDRFIGIWHDDAVWEIGPPFGTFESHKGIHEAVFEVLYPAWRETHHLTTNVRVVFKDPDHATGECDVDCMGANPEGVVQMVGATYVDDFERRAGEWKISKRVVNMHYFNAMPGIEMSKP